MKKRIKLIVHFYISNRDKWGNCYYAVRVTNTSNRKMVTFGISHTSNFNACVYDLGLEWDEVYTIEEYVGYRDWSKSYYSYTEYCHGEDMAIAIRSAFKWRKKK